MSQLQKIMFYFILPAVALFFYPPSWLVEGLPVIGAAVLLIAFLGYQLMRGKSLALTFSIFLQGMNVIIRLMMFFSRSVTNTGIVDYVYIITCLIGLALSMYLVLRLDQRDIRIQMVS